MTYGSYKREHRPGARFFLAVRRAVARASDWERGSADRWTEGTALESGYATVMDLVDLRSGFRDDDQRRRAGMVVHVHLADDRNQDECRYLLKFQWQRHMSYQEVTMAQLREHVGVEKLAAVEGRIAAVAQSPEAIDRWIEETVATYPVIKDRGYEQWHRRQGNPRWTGRLRLVAPAAQRLVDWLRHVRSVFVRRRS